MLHFLRERLESGPIEASIMAVGGNVQVALKVKIEQVDEVGMVCRSKGMLGGWSDLHVRPWACVAQVMFS